MRSSKHSTFKISAAQERAREEPHFHREEHGRGRVLALQAVPHTQQHSHDTLRRGRMVHVPAPLPAIDAHAERREDDGIHGHLHGGDGVVAAREPVTAPREHHLSDVGVGMQARVVTFAQVEGGRRKKGGEKRKRPQGKVKGEAWVSRGMRKTGCSFVLRRPWTFPHQVGMTEGPGAACAGGARSAAFDVRRREC